MPTLFVTTGWIWGLVALTGFSLVATALMRIAQRPVQRSYAAALAGLTAEQRSQVVRVLRWGSRRTEGATPSRSWSSRNNALVSIRHPRT